MSPTPPEYEANVVRSWRSDRLPLAIVTVAIPDYTVTPRKIMRSAPQHDGIVA
jgi:hypothetical protein